MQMVPAFKYICYEFSYTMNGCVHMQKIKRNDQNKIFFLPFSKCRQGKEMKGIEK